MNISLVLWAPLASANINEATHSWKPGDIVHVGNFSNGTNGVPRFVSLNLRNLPDKVEYEYQFRRIKKMMESSYQIGLGQGELRRRAFRVDLRLMPTNMRQTLLQQRGLTLEWDVAKAYIAKKVVVNNFDYTTDTNTIITDAAL